MTRSEIALLLGAMAARDQRTIGDTDVLAWHEDIGDLGFDEARQAVSRHYRESVERIKPAHVRQHVKVIRAEQRAAAEVRELPSRYEDDTERDQRIARNKAKISEVLQQIAAKRSVPDAPAEQLTPSDEIRARAITRAQNERRRAS
jgi:hypothetical protein